MKTKKCPCCQKEFPIEDYPVYQKTVRGRVVSYRYSYCRLCRKQKKADKYRTNTEFRERMKLRSVLRNYNLSQEEYLSLFEQQNHCCAICGVHSSVKKLVVDHCHRTGQVRALLCHRCNFSIVMFDESPDLLLKVKN